MNRKAERIVGLDVGTRSIGIAVSDEAQIIVSPKKAILFSKGVPWKELVRRIQELKANLVVIGHPFEADGSIGQRAKKVQKISCHLERMLGSIRCVLHDERYSTWAAKRKFGGLKLSKSTQEQNIDSFAAMEILSSYLQLPTKDF